MSTPNLSKEEQKRRAREWSNSVLKKPKPELAEHASAPEENPAAVSQKRKSNDVPMTENKDKQKQRRYPQTPTAHHSDNASSREDQEVDNATSTSKEDQRKRARQWAEKNLPATKNRNTIGTPSALPASATTSEEPTRDRRLSFDHATPGRRRRSITNADDSGDSKRLQQNAEPDFRPSTDGNSADVGGGPRLTFDDGPSLLRPQMNVGTKLPSAPTLTFARNAQEIEREVASSLNQPTLDLISALNSSYAQEEDDELRQPDLRRFSAMDWDDLNMKAVMGKLTSFLIAGLLMTLIVTTGQLIRTPLPLLLPLPVCLYALVQYRRRLVSAKQETENIARLVKALMREHRGIHHPVEYWKQELKDQNPSLTDTIDARWPQVLVLVRLDPRTIEYKGQYQGRAHTLWGFEGLLAPATQDRVEHLLERSDAPAVARSGISMS